MNDAPAPADPRLVAASPPRSVVVIGGGLAGLAATAALAERGVPVTLLEARQNLGGRAGSYVDAQSGERIDNCQHVGMGCCTNFADFCRRTGLLDGFDRHRTLYFFGRDGRCSKFRGTRGLPAPLHLAAGLARMKHLSLADRMRIGNSLMALGRLRPESLDPTVTVADWLASRRASTTELAGFWEVVLVSALSERLERIGLAAARHVFVDGFMRHASSYELMVPRRPLGELYDEALRTKFDEWGVDLRLGVRVKRIDGDATSVKSLELQSGSDPPFRVTPALVILAAPWHRLGEMLAPELAAEIPELPSLERFETAPITSVHLWLDRAPTTLPHGVIVGRLSQWFFNRGETRIDDRRAFLAQVVVSASGDLRGRPLVEIADEVQRDLAAVFPALRAAQRLHFRVITERTAVFSPLPGVDDVRPAQRTRVPNLVLAGDWTRTGWPATMEGAVRSGYLAAEATLKSLGRAEEVLRPDLPASRVARLLGVRFAPPRAGLT